MNPGNLEHLARRATPEDVHEVLRLRQVMLDSVHGPDGAGGSDADAWQADALPVLKERLAEPDGGFAAFVVDHPDRTERPGALAAMAAGTTEYRIGGPGNPHGRVGYVFSVATDPGTRRRGYSRACMEALLGWFREQGAARVDLNASEQGEPLYASLGFVRKPDPSMRLTL